MATVICKSGYIPEELGKAFLRQSQRFGRVQECGDFRIMALISHALKGVVTCDKKKNNGNCGKRRKRTSDGIRSEMSNSKCMNTLRMTFVFL